MANQITDNRINLTTADSLTGIVDLGGAGAGTVDTEIFYQGTGSISYYTSNTRSGILYNSGANNNWTGSTFYLLVNCGIAGLLDTKANGGLTVRFCSSTVTNWFEVRIAGSDNYPPAFSGGWVQLVVNIDTARAAAITNGWTNGTPPPTGSVQYVGITTVTGGTMPRMADNTWLDQISRLPSGTPGIIVEGRNGGSTDWNFNNIVTSAVTTNKWATARPGAGGSIVLSTPVQIGINDTTTHGFRSTNRTITWADQEFIPNGFYGINALGNAGGTTNINFGVKTGTGVNATGAQGVTVQSNSNLTNRYFLNFSDPNVDLVGLYGCSFQSGGAFTFNDPAVQAISSLFINCTSASIPTITDYLQNKVINSNTVASTAFLTTNNLDDIVESEFEFSAGHAVQLTSAGTGSQTWDAITTGFAAGTSGTNVTATSVGNETLFLNFTSAATFTINVATGATTPSIRKAAGMTGNVNIVAGAVTLQITVQNTSGTPIENARALITAGTGGPFPGNVTVTITTSTTTATVSHTAHGLSNGDRVLITGALENELNGIQTISNVTTNTYDYTITSIGNASGTGTIKSSFVIISGLTNASGIISDTRTYSTNQPLGSNSRVRKSSGSPYYKTGPVVGTVNSTSGANITVVLLDDE